MAPRHRRNQPVHLRHRAHPGLVFVFTRRHLVALPAVLPTPPPSPHRRIRRGATPQEPAELQPVYLCERFAATGSCPNGNGSCPDAHADMSQAKVFRPHHRCGDDGNRDGHPRELPHHSGTTTLPPPPAGHLPATLGDLHVAAANDCRATLVVPAAMCLATRAVVGRQDDAPPPSVCVHFVQKGVCDFGAECLFLHPLVDPQPLPAPSPLVVLATPPGGPVRNRDGFPASSDDNASLASFADNLHTPCKLYAHALVDTTHDARAPSHPRFRHEPYGAQGWVASAAPAAPAEEGGSKQEGAASKRSMFLAAPHHDSFGGTSLGSWRHCIAGGV